MRPRAAMLAGFAGWLLAPAIAAHALDAGDIAWGCEDAGYAGPVERDGHETAQGTAQGTGHRTLVLLVHTDWGVLPATSELPEGQVYTGGAPTCTDLDGDGTAEVVAAVAGPGGAWLTVYGKRTGPIVSTAPVAGGLSVVGGADMDGDGTAELAWIEDAGGAGRLRVAGLRDGSLAEIASADGFAGRRPDGTAAASVNGCAKDGTGLIVRSPDRGGFLRIRLDGRRLVSEPVPDATDQGAQPLAGMLECARAQHEETQ